MYSLIAIACFFFFVAGWAFANVLDIFIEHYYSQIQDDKSEEKINVQ